MEKMQEMIDKLREEMRVTIKDKEEMISKLR